jgi:hypothetical protein
MSLKAAPARPGRCRTSRESVYESGGLQEACLPSLSSTAAARPSGRCRLGRRRGSLNPNEVGFASSRYEDASSEKSLA